MRLPWSGVRGSKSERKAALTDAEKRKSKTEAVEAPVGVSQIGVVAFLTTRVFTRRCKQSSCLWSSQDIEREGGTRKGEKMLNS